VVVGFEHICFSKLLEDNLGCFFFLRGIEDWCCFGICADKSLTGWSTIGEIPVMMNHDINQQKSSQIHKQWGMVWWLLSPIFSCTGIIPYEPYESIIFLVISVVFPYVSWCILGTTRNTATFSARTLAPCRPLGAVPSFSSDQGETPNPSPGFMVDITFKIL